jgi:predicted TIM-barrel fold metal-dependent hydrolase
MGWPLDLGKAGYEQWRHDLTVLSHCANVRIEIAAIECLFGMGWRQEQVAPWILSVIETFGPSRCMFGSHLPIASLSVGFESLYNAYQEIVTRFSAAEQDDMFRGTAAAWFKPR